MKKKLVQDSEGNWYLIDPENSKLFYWLDKESGNDGDWEDFNNWFYNDQIDSPVGLIIDVEEEKIK